MSQSDKNSKKEKLRAAIQGRVDKEEHAYRLVEKMALSDSVDKEFLVKAGKYITVSQYKDVTEERAVAKLCGYALCNNRITQVLTQKYKISVREKKVYDLTERKNFCSNKCYKASKYFESQLSSEPVWMREKTKSPVLKLFEDDEELMKNFSGYGEEVLATSQGKDGEHEHVETKHEHAENKNDHIDDENEHFDYEHENHDYEREHRNHEHESPGGEHENIDNGNEDDNEREHLDDIQEYDNFHKLSEFDDNELGCIVERLADVKIELDVTDSDDDIDDIDDGIDDIDDHDQIESSAMGENVLNEKDLHNDDANDSEKKSESKLCSEKVHEVLQEWCCTETKKFLRKSFRDKKTGLLQDEKNSNEVMEESNQGEDSGGSVMLPSIDSKSQNAIRGKIVSDKITKAMSPMLFKLSLTKADVSSQLTCLLRTFRFTNTNIVLKPSEWTLLALTLLLVLVKFDQSLTALLSSRQKDLHSLLGNTVDNEDEVDRLLDMFNFEDDSAPAMLDGQQQFDMEELD